MGQWQKLKIENFESKFFQKKRSFVKSLHGEILNFGQKVWENQIFRLRTLIDADRRGLLLLDVF